MNQLRMAISGQRHRFGVGPIGGSTVVIDYANTRFVTDPTFNGPTDFETMRKTEGPSVSASGLEPIDYVLLSHEAHLDNFDPEGRAMAKTVKTVFTSRQSARSLRGNSVGLKVGQRRTVPSFSGSTSISITAVDAVHGPLDGTVDATGHVNAEVIGFVLEGDGLPTVYVSGDNASIEPLPDIAARFPRIDVAVLSIGAARLDTKFHSRPLTFTSERAADAALILGAPLVVPAHYRGWSIYTEGEQPIRKAFDDAGIANRLRIPHSGDWAVLDAAG
jgi:L-ascorbate metabolism protein UlaG (beta-lactamase superfamily)